MCLFFIHKYFGKHSGVILHGYGSENVSSFDDLLYQSDMFLQYPEKTMADVIFFENTTVYCSDGIVTRSILLQIDDSQLGPVRGIVAAGGAVLPHDIDFTAL